jgi:hypothetical protein
MVMSTFCRSIFYRSTLCCLTLCRSTLCRLTLCRLTLCRLTLCRLTLCRLTLCCLTFWFWATGFQHYYVAPLIGHEERGSRMFIVDPNNKSNNQPITMSANMKKGSGSVFTPQI